MTFFYYIASLFSTDANVKRLQNKLAHFAVEYQKSRVKIADARKTFEEVRENTVSDFEKLKKSTIDKTAEAVSIARGDILAEEVEVEAEFEVAKEKIEAKRNSITDLSKAVNDIGGADYPLD